MREHDDRSRMTGARLLAIATVAVALGRLVSGPLADEPHSTPDAHAGANNVALHANIELVGGSFFSYGWGGCFASEPQSVVDGVFLPREITWCRGSVWWDSRDGRDRAIMLELEGVFEIDSLIVQADNNDAYILEYRDIDTGDWRIAWHVPAISGWGMQTRPDPADDTERYLLPNSIVTDAFLLRGDPHIGDSSRSISEIQAFGERYGHPFEELTLVAADLRFARESDADELAVAGTFTLGYETDGIDVLNEDVTVRVGPSEFTIPGGSFSRTHGIVYPYSGTIAEADVYAVFKDLGDDAWAFYFQAQSIDLNPIENPVECSVSVGDDSGEEAVRVSGRLSAGGNIVIPAGTVRHGDSPSTGAE